MGPDMASMRGTKLQLGDFCHQVGRNVRLQLFLRLLVADAPCDSFQGLFDLLVRPIRIRRSLRLGGSFLSALRLLTLLGLLVICGSNFGRGLVLRGGVRTGIRCGLNKAVYNSLNSSGRMIHRLSVAGAVRIPASRISV